MSRIIIFLLGALLSLQVFSAITLNPLLDGTDKVRFEKYLSIAKKAEPVLNSEKFKAEVLSYKFSSTNLNNQQIWEKMERGAELLIPEANGVWDWKVGFYLKSSSKVVGWTNGKILTVWVNKKFFDKYSDAEIMANIVHEYLHKIGFDHSSASDYKSVPYHLGYFARDLYKSGAYVSETTPIEVPEPQEPPIPAIKKMSWWSRLLSIFK